MAKDPIIFFDGICNLCNSAVQFTISHDKRGVFKFTTLQGEYAKLILPTFKVDISTIDTIILLENDKLYRKSSAALKIAKRLDGLWPLLYGCIILPKFIRDRLYDIIAKNRYKWWGQQESCWIPTPELKSKFLN